ncbi:UNVERIFIED_CONTAM: hypothetical protein Slati_3480800 [Sesamum latifolium]|uniref:G-patch domain-containing protein n=1 Tax=Sesamum latifolium TaxID=2727402 RepID=A0AAW2UHQ0_9LAMI
MAVNVAPFKLRSKANNGVPNNSVPYEKPQRKLTLKEMQARQYPLLDSDVFGIFDDLSEANLIDLSKMKRPEEAKRKDDPKYYKYHRLVGHVIQDCFVFKDKVMQLARQGKISLEEDSATTNLLSTKCGSLDGKRASCNTAHTINEDGLEKKDFSNANECVSIITFTDEDLLLGSKPHNRHLFVAGYAREQKDAKKGKEVLPSEEPKSYNSQSVRKDDSSAIEIELSKGLILPLTQINMKQPSKPPLKEFVPSTQEERGHDALAIDEKGFDPKAFKLLIKAGYNPKEKLSLENFPPEATGKKLHGLNATQIMLKEKGHAIQDS